MKIKILPITITVCSLLVVVRVADITGFNFIETSRAENTDEQKPAAADAKKDDATMAPVKDDSKTAEAKPAATADDKKTPDAKKDDVSADKKDKLPDNVTTEKPKEQNLEFTESEKQLLEKLATRRAELDARQSDLDMKESLLDASSKKLDEKLAQLTQLKSDTETLLKTYNDHEDVKIKSMVKIYENMKPAAAAQIFGEMDMDVVLEIVDKMAEKKVSPVLAAMDPKKAEKLTEDLVKKRSLVPPDVRQAAADQTAQKPVQPIASN